ncbi:unnamed protein product [Cyprideis torosa]|uniref:Uncharacterized protein n=1 Tax=Cyprideis torosa TaxID=163714 RepID=A0A7R8WEN2_9CRUS|nr:unnamed protein product [Cyprideis torosa]CAG0890517.1 unnamed protein product [Cyprideis torosa]
MSSSGGESGEGSGSHRDSNGQSSSKKSMALKLSSMAMGLNTVKGAGSDDRKARRSDLDQRYEYLFTVISFTIGMHRMEILDQLIATNQMEEVSDFFVCGRSRKLLWFYQDFEITESSRQGSDEVEHRTPDVKGSALAPLPGAAGGGFTSFKGSGGINNQRALPPITNQRRRSSVPPQKIMKKQLMLNDGSDFPMKNIAIYALKINMDRHITEDNIPKEVTCGVATAAKTGMLVTFERLLSQLFIPAINETSTDLDRTREGQVAKKELLGCLHAFSSLLTASKEAMRDKVILNDLDVVNATPFNCEEIVSRVDRVFNTARYERIVCSWMEVLDKVLIENGQLRRECDDAGPLKELEHWRKKSCILFCLLQQIRSPEVRAALKALQSLKSARVKEWVRLENGITDCFHISKNNLQYLKSIEKHCHVLYWGDPQNMSTILLPFFNNVRLIHTISPHYNTSEQLSGLLIKVTNQIIKTCKTYIAFDQSEATTLTQPPTEMIKRFHECIELYEKYRQAYETVQESMMSKGEHPFEFSQQYVFGKFDTFCKRIQMILNLFELVDKYRKFFRSRVEGLLPEDKSLEEILHVFAETVQNINGKSYDYLDYKNKAFDEDYREFTSRIEALVEQVRLIMEDHLRDVWTSPHGFQFLQRLQRIDDRLKGIDLNGKYDLILCHYSKTLNRVRENYNRQRETPPVQRCIPTVPANIMWVRSLVRHLRKPMRNFKKWRRLKRDGEEGRIVRRHDVIVRILREVEGGVHESWQEDAAERVDRNLKVPLLTRSDEDGEAIVNLDPVILSLVREAESIYQMNLNIPGIVDVLVVCQLKIIKKRILMENLLDQHRQIIQKISPVLKPILVSHMGKLEEEFQPAYKTLTWTSSNVYIYVHHMRKVLGEFGTLVDRMNDLYKNRIEAVLQNMYEVQIQPLPKKSPWTLEDFLEASHTASLKAVTELQAKSTLMEESILELLDLILKTDPLRKDEIRNKGGIMFPRTSGGWENLVQNPISPLAKEQKAARRRKELQERIDHAAAELRRYYNLKVLDAIVRATKRGLDEISGCVTVENKMRSSSQSIDDECNEIPNRDEQTHRFYLTMSLHDSKLKVEPSVEEIHETVVKGAKMIVSVSRGVSQWVKQSIQQVNGQQCTSERGNVQETSSNIKESDKPWFLQQFQKGDPWAIPTQQKNYYQYVTEHKDVSRSIGYLNSCLQEMKHILEVIFNQWDKYSLLWSEEREKTVKEFLLTQPTVADFEDKINGLLAMKQQILNEPGSYEVGPLHISLVTIKELVNIEVKQWISRYGRACKAEYRRKMDKIFAQINDLSRKLNRPIRDLEDLRIGMQALTLIREKEIDMEMLIDPIEEAFALLLKHDVRLTREESEKVDSLRYTWHKLQAQAIDLQNTLTTLQPQFQHELVSNLTQFKTDCAAFVKSYRRSGPMVPGLEPREASDRLVIFQNQFDSLWRRHRVYSAGEELFGLDPSEFPELISIKKELNLLQKLYRLYNDVIDRVTSYYDFLWGDVNIEEINNELMDFQNRCRKLPKGLKEWPAFNTLKKTIDDFNDMCPLLELMSNKAMKSRHWQRIADITKHEFAIEDDSFSLKRILQAPLLQHKEDIEDICISAVKEKDIEAKLRQVTNEWSQHELHFMTFKNRGELLLRGDHTAEIITLLEDSLMVLGSLFSNRYNAPFRKQIQKWVQDLSNTNEILERWLFVQNLWVYLEAVFVGGDIAKQLPKEAKRFYSIDKSWQKIMTRAHEIPNVVQCCVGDDSLKQLLPHLQEQLELCQKSLSGYLERKRLMFPRFFFVSDPALLEILGQASDSHTIQCHLLSIFDNIKSVIFHDQDYDRITTIVSSEGEAIQLEKAVRADGSVEVWLMRLLQIAQQSLHSIIRSAYLATNDPNFNVLHFLGSYPSQVGILGLQMIWTRDSEYALMQSRTDRRIMMETNNRFLDLLNILISQTTKELGATERTKFETLITVHVHQRDIFDNLCRLNVRSLNDFEWLKQCRFYFKEEADKTQINITDVSFSYQNEFLGCTERLVITPLTDKCYITLAQALGMSMGGSPTGPAGTGKTETVKDMGKTLGKYVVVFNCSDQMDYRGLGRIFKGLAQSGSWGCFDEFNRIDLPVLSVAAQQIAVVLSCKKERKKTFTFTDGDVVDMNSEFGIFLTMNPGYAGRQELPENLKIQFRTVAMMVPDRQIIIRVKLASCGFLENITLARKFFTLYKLCEEQLTKQVHYDFGLRNVLSVLRTLGSAKRANPKDSESTIVMRVLRDMNLSKLVDEDEPLFISLVNDLFPNIQLDKSVYPELEAAIANQVKLSGLINHPPWVLKLIQLYETQRVRHGIMALGPGGSGKTSCIQILMKALTQLGKPHREMRMNPKAITAPQMFGRLDVATNDWTDGIFSTLWRRTHKVKKGEHVWLVLDGPVDAIWIENLNSVLDDNRTLTLANGDRIPMAPHCKVIFEPHNIDNASPATVSRNGMVYMSSTGLNWEPLFKAWVAKRGKTEQNVLSELFKRTFLKIFIWSTQNLTYRMSVLQVNIVTQMLTLLQGILEDFKPQVKETVGLLRRERSEDEDIPNVTQESGVSTAQIHRSYVFALMWSIGAFLELDDREKFDAYLRQHNQEFELDLPKITGNKMTMFDFHLAKEGWIHWSTKVEHYVYPENFTPEFSSILVPNVDNVRTDYLISVVAKQNKPVLLIGEQGTAKTVMMEAYLRKNANEMHLTRKLNFSSASTSMHFQKTMEGYIDKRIGNTYGPPAGKRMTVFIDDINMPAINEWGDQVTNEIVRQTIELGGFYNLEKPGDFTSVVDVQYVAAMIQPGGGRNDIPHRLKRHFSIFNCTLPTEESIDKIFGVIALGHYGDKRGFTKEVQSLVSELVPLTRKLWAITKKTLLPTPAKFHYVFNLRDLSRIWQGMIGTMANVIDSPKTLLKLWKHECCRVIADRFITEDDKLWFENTLHATVTKELGESHTQMINRSEFFVDFLRDAPEPTGEETDDLDIEMPKVYEPIPSFDVLQERLNMFLFQYNDIIRGSGMDLVFFRDAMIHIVKISRIIRNPGGNALLVGVGGSGKQSLTKLASFIAGYKTFQITMTRSYNVNNFLEDLKILYRTCGIQGKGTTFIFTDQDVKDEGFLEYLNNVLSSGVVSNLFNRDEQGEIITELIPIMKREHPRRPPTPENIMEFFVSRVRQNLHVVLCFSPVGEKFRNRAQKFPGLFSGCTINWFQQWPEDALVAVAKHYLDNFDIICTDIQKGELVKAMGKIHALVSEYCGEYFERYRRTTHVTPKSYLSFLNSYKSIYTEKQTQLNDMAQRMDSGLAKLQEASESVAHLRRELTVMEKDLAIASEKAEMVLAEVTARADEAEKFRNQVQRKNDDAQALVNVIAIDKALAEEKLEDARPALEEAEKALNTIKPAHIATVRKLGRPPHLIMRIMDCVLILFRRKLHPVAPEEFASIKPSWSESLKMMASTTFLQQLQNFPKDTINDEMIELLEPYFNMEDYDMETASRVCGDVAGLLSWTRSMAAFYAVNKEVLPLKANLAIQESRLAVADRELQKTEEELRQKEEELQIVREQYSNALEEKQRLLDAANQCRRKMQAAEKLINGLAGEKKRWTKQSKTFKEQLGLLIGDVLLATGFLCYSGPFNQKYRAKLKDAWKAIVEKHKIPMSIGINLITMMTDPTTIAEWTFQGLPNDDLSIQNAIIVTKTVCFPLLVDPQGQGKLWIKNRESRNELQITSLNHKYFRSHLEDSLSLGRPLLIEDVEEELDPVLDNLLERNYIKSGTTEKVLIGDKEYDIMPGFTLYITTKLPNPAYAPEVSAKVAIIDFTVTLKGLEDQLLGKVILTEQSELEAERVQLLEDVMEHKKSICHLEDNLLFRLTSCETSLVDDEDLICVLQDTKTTAEEVTQKLQVAADTEAKINEIREEFRPVATRGSILYFLLVEMSDVNVMYQSSLRQFLVLFELSMAKSELAPGIQERIANIIQYLTFSVWKYASRGFYERHKFLFTLLLAIKIALQRGDVSHHEFMVLIKGGASLDLKCVEAKPFKWILDITWLNLVQLSTIPQFSGILRQVAEYEKEWKVWFDKDYPEECEFPCGYSDVLDSFRTLLLIRSWCPDRTLSQAKKFIKEELGDEFAEPPILDLEKMWEESDPQTPLICFLSLGADPSHQIDMLVKSKDIKVRAISMGQGQEIHGRRLLYESMENGGWVLLQNCHLSLEFCSEICDLIQETGNIHKSFRLWITTEVHPQFPINLLQSSIKYTNEPPQGIKASLKRTYANISQDLLDYTTAPQWQPLLYSVAFLHMTVLERRKYGPLGWNIPYDFNEADFNASVQFIQNHLDDMDPKKGVSWTTVCYMLGEVQYGGRVTDDFDHHLLKTYAHEWFTEKLFSHEFSFHGGYTIPRCRNIPGYMKFINDLPSNDSPQVFGLHPNADITYQINTARTTLDTILSIQPKEGAALGGETRETVVQRLANDMLEKLPARYVDYEVKEFIQKMGGLLPMNIFLRQEIYHMKKIIMTVHENLVDVKLAIDGTIVMSESLREALDAMYDARVPEAWRKISWQSTTLGFWFTELVERDIQFRKWLFQGRPNVFWMTGMFNPQGFLTAMRQEVTRNHKGWALDCVVLQNMVTKFTKDDVTDSPPEGVYVHGLYLEGASWDRKRGKLAESRPKVLYEALPVIYIYAINSTAGKDPKTYECPIYRKPQRTLENYIGSIDFETEVSPSHWTLRGVALLCDIK